MKLRFDQQKLHDSILSAKQFGIPATLATSATGTGKTVVFSGIVKTLGAGVCALAHRKELLAQISETFSRFHIEHDIIAPLKTVRTISDLQYKNLGFTCIRPNSKNYIASVDTVRARENQLTGMFHNVKYWILDEGHHALKENKWGGIIRKFKNAQGLGVTATDWRADGRSLKSDAGGIYDYRIKGPTTKDALRSGNLCPYRLFAPPNSIRVDAVPVGKNGDFSRVKLAEAAENSQIIGDVTSHYQKLAAGLKTICFCTDVKTSRKTAAQFRALGYPAVHLDAESSETERACEIAKYRLGDTLILCNVDLFGEGFDVPDVEAVIFARSTWSAGLFWQQFGRLLRIFPGKTHGIAIDAVGNILRHGIPEAPLYEYSWDKGRDGKRVANPGNPPLRTCAHCYKPFMAYSLTCPFCGHKPTMEKARKIEEIEGDLTEIPLDILAAIRGEIKKVDAPPDITAKALQASGASRGAVYGFRKKHEDRQRAQTSLREAISRWGGREKFRGLPPDARYIKFFKHFGVDVLTAQTLGRPKAEELTHRIIKNLNEK